MFSHAKGRVELVDLEASAPMVHAHSTRLARARRLHLEMAWRLWGGGEANHPIIDCANHVGFLSGAVFSASRLKLTRRAGLCLRDVIF